MAVRRARHAPRDRMTASSRPARGPWRQRGALRRTAHAKLSSAATTSRDHRQSTRLRASSLRNVRKSRSSRSVATGARSYELLFQAQLVRGVTVIATARRRGHAGSALIDLEHRAKLAALCGCSGTRECDADLQREESSKGRSASRCRARCARRRAHARAMRAKRSAPRWFSVSTIERRAMTKWKTRGHQMSAAKRP